MGEVGRDRKGQVRGGKGEGRERRGEGNMARRGCLCIFALQCIHLQTHRNL